MYAILKQAGVPVPRHIIVSRDGLPEGVDDPPGFIEVCVGGGRRGRRRVLASP